MKYKTVTSIAAILSLLNAAFFIIAPVFTLSVLGRETNNTGIMNMRFFGASALGLAVITWLARDVKYPEVRRLMCYGWLIIMCLLVVIDLNGLLTGAMNYLGWIMFCADLFLTLGFVSTLFTGGGRDQ